LPESREVFDMMPNVTRERRRGRNSFQFPCECGKVVILTKVQPDTTCSCGLQWHASKNMSFARAKEKHRVTVVRYALP